MPRESITVLLELRATCTIIHANQSVPAPLPVEESDVESAAEDVPHTKAELAETNDEPEDSTMKEEGDEKEENDDDDEDPETSF